MAVSSIFDIDIKGVDKAAKAIGTVNKALSSTASAVKAVVKTGGVASAVGADKQKIALNQQLNKEIDRTESALERVEERLKKTSRIDAYRRLSGEAAELQSRIESLRMEQEALNDSVGDMPTDFGMMGMGGGGYGGFGFGGPGQNMSSAFRSVGQIAGGGGFNTSALGEMMDGMSQALEMGSQLGMDLGEMANQAKMSGGVLGRSMGGALGMLSKAAGPASAALAGVSLGFQAFDIISGKSTAQIEKNIAARRRELDLTNERNEMLRTGSAESIREQIAALEDQIEATEATRDASISAATAETNTLDQVRTVSEAMLNQFLGRGLEGTTIYGQAADAIRDYNEELGQQQDRLRMLQDIQDDVAAREKAEEAAMRVKDAEEELISIRQEAADAAERYAEEVQRFEEDAAFNRARELEDRAIQDARDAEDHARELARAEEDYNKRIEDMREDHLKSLADMEEELGKSLADLDESLAKSIADANKDYMRNQRDELEAHIKEMARAEKAYQKERLRRLEDLNDELASAEMENDVVRFIQAQQQGAKDLKRMREDHEESQGESGQQFEERMAQAAEEHQRNLAQMREQAAEQRAEMLEQYEEQKQAAIEALQEQLAAEKESHAESLAETKANFERQRKLEEENRAFQDARAKEDHERQLQQMRDGYQREVDALRDREQEALSVIKFGGYDQVRAVQSVQNSMTQAWRNIAQSAVNAVSGFSSGFSGGASRSFTSGGSSGRSFFTPTGRGVFAAKGALIDRPTLMVAGEGNKPELVVPFDESQGIPRDVLGKLGGGGETYNFNLGSITIGDGVSEAVVRQALNDMGRTLVQAIADARAGGKAK